MGFNTFSTALSGLSTNTQGLNVVGNNLANINTVGYKATSISFMEVLGQKVSAGGTAKSSSSGHVGLGATVGNISGNFTQGGVETTNNPTDVAIQGSGFFVVSDGAGTFYTRGGNFHTDADGNLVTATGHFVQGYIKNATSGVIDENSNPVNVKIPSTTGNSSPTETVELAFNLDGSSAVGDTFSTTFQTYDTLGAPHLATISFVKSATSATETRWKFDVTVPHKDMTGIASTSTDNFSLLTGAIATTPITAGGLVFDSNGKLKSSYIGTEPATLPAAANLKVPPTGITIPSFGNSATLSSNGMTWKLISASGAPNATGLAAVNNVTFNTQDGVPPGDMNSLLIQGDGSLAGVFSNGLTVVVAKIALAQFNNENGLSVQGSGLFTESAASGSVILGTPGQGGRGRLVGGSLELFNVDLAAEFTKIITFQRGYQANARMLTTTDQILQETMNLRN